jgi:simple sugar transport system ATP-binding protein
MKEGWTLDEFLRMEHVSKRFGDFYANREIDLTVRRGEVHTLLARTAPASPR